MPQTDLEIALSGLGKFMATGEIDLDIVDEAIEIYDHDILDGYDYRGKDGFVKWLDDWAQAWSDWRFAPEEFYDGNGTVVIVGKMTAKGARSGIEIERQDGLVYRFRDGKIARLDYFNTRHQAIEAAGLSDTSLRPRR